MFRVSFGKWKTVTSLTLEDIPQRDKRQPDSRSRATQFDGPSPCIMSLQRHGQGTRVTYIRLKQDERKDHRTQNLLCQ